MHIVCAYHVCSTEHACLLAAHLHIRIGIILRLIKKAVQVLSGYCSSCSPSQYIPASGVFLLPVPHPLPY